MVRVIESRNVHEALPAGLSLLRKIGVKRNSRNGPVLVAQEPVATVYQKPCERVLFWPQRDANPFFHLYESLWMLAGRRDIEPLVYLASNMASYSDDGKTMHDAYGCRWRKWFGLDQLAVIAERLTKDPDDRRSVLQMWDVSADLGRDIKSVPCNTLASFQRNHDGALDLTVFCRSNDIIWGAYGANAVQFSTLLEYMAIWIGCPIGKYTQISVNWHAYKSTMFDVTDLEDDNPYDSHVFATPMIDGPLRGQDAIDLIDSDIRHVLAAVDSEFIDLGYAIENSYYATAYYVLKAHHLWKTLPPPERYDEALKLLLRLDQSNDWVVAAKEWIGRRYEAWKRKQTNGNPV